MKHMIQNKNTLHTNIDFSIGIMNRYTQLGKAYFSGMSLSYLKPAIADETASTVCHVLEMMMFYNHTHLYEMMSVSQNTYATTLLKNINHELTKLYMTRNESSQHFSALYQAITENPSIQVRTALQNYFEKTLITLRKTDNKQFSDVLVSKLKKILHKKEGHSNNTFDTNTSHLSQENTLNHIEAFQSNELLSVYFNQISSGSLTFKRKALNRMIQLLSYDSFQHMVHDEQVIEQMLYNYVEVMNHNKEKFEIVLKHQTDNQLIQQFIHNKDIFSYVSNLENHEQFQLLKHFSSDDMFILNKDVVEAVTFNLVNTIEQIKNESQSVIRMSLHHAVQSIHDGQFLEYIQQNENQIITDLTNRSWLTMIASNHEETSSLITDALSLSYESQTNQVSTESLEIFSTHVLNQLRNNTVKDFKLTLNNNDIMHIKNDIKNEIMNQSHDQVFQSTFLKKQVIKMIHDELKFSNASFHTTEEIKDYIEHVKLSIQSNPAFHRALSVYSQDVLNNYFDASYLEAKNLFKNVEVILNETFEANMSNQLSHKDYLKKIIESHSNQSMVLEQVIDEYHFDNHSSFCHNVTRFMNDFDENLETIYKKNFETYHVNQLINSHALHELIEMSVFTFEQSKNLSQENNHHWISSNYVEILNQLNQYESYLMKDLSAVITNKKHNTLISSWMDKNELSFHSVLNESFSHKESFEIEKIQKKYWQHNNDLVLINHLLDRNYRKTIENVNEFFTQYMLSDEFKTYGFQVFHKNQIDAVDIMSLKQYSMLLNPSKQLNVVNVNQMKSFDSKVYFLNKDQHSHSTYFTSLSLVEANRKFSRYKSNISLNYLSKEINHTAEHDYKTYLSNENQAVYEAIKNQVFNHLSDSMDNYKSINNLKNYNDVLYQYLSSTYNSQKITSHENNEVITKIFQSQYSYDYFDEQYAVFQGTIHQKPIYENILNRIENLFIESNRQLRIRALVKDFTTNKIDFKHSKRSDFTNLYSNHSELNHLYHKTVTDTSLNSVVSENNILNRVNEINQEMYEHQRTLIESSVNRLLTENNISNVLRLNSEKLYDYQKLYYNQWHHVSSSNNSSFDQKMLVSHSETYNDYAINQLLHFNHNDQHFKSHNIASLTQLLESKTNVLNNKSSYLTADRVIQYQGLYHFTEKKHFNQQVDHLVSKHFVENKPSLMQLSMSNIKTEIATTHHALSLIHEGTNHNRHVVQTNNRVDHTSFNKTVTTNSSTDKYALYQQATHLSHVKKEEKSSESKTETSYQQVKDTNREIVQILETHKNEINELKHELDSQVKKVQVMESNMTENKTDHHATYYKQITKEVLKDVTRQLKVAKKRYGID